MGIEAIRRAVEDLDEKQLYELLGLVEDRLSAMRTREFPDLLMDVIRQHSDVGDDHADGIVRVSFPTMDYDDGRFFHTTATVTWPNGYQDEIDLFGTAVEDALTGMSRAYRAANGALRQDSRLTVEYPSGAILF